MTSLAKPLPLLVIASVLGFPEADLPRLQRWADQVEDWFGGPAPLVQRCRECQAALQEYTAYARTLARALAGQDSDAGGGGGGSLARPRPVLCELLGSPGMSESAALANGFFIMSAAYETTAALIGGTLHALLTKPEALAVVREQGASDAAVYAAVTEALRFCSPIKCMFRECTADIVLRTGEMLRKGDGINFINTALNLDAAVFSQPLEFDIARPAKESRRHVGFGLGAHRCPGWRLGVLEACEVVQAVLWACPRLELAAKRDEIKWRELESLNCLAALPVKG